MDVLVPWTQEAGGKFLAVERWRSALVQDSLRDCPREPPPQTGVYVRLSPTCASASAGL